MNSVAMNSEAVLKADSGGLFCKAGGFFVDPWRPADVAVITHAHADHARRGSRRYLALESSVPVLRHRLGSDIVIDGLRPGESVTLGDARVSLHPAGHVLGSAQVRVETEAGVWVVTGDFKRDPDPTCAPFEPVPCDVLITEATFALPVYRWPPAADVAREIHAWWRANAAAGRPSVLFCYAFGKAQRVLAELAAFTDEPVHVHGAVQAITELYRDAGVAMLPTRLVESRRRSDYAEALVIAPPGAGGGPWMRRFGACATGFCSGWMAIRGQRRRRGHDRGFVLSDHADWKGLIATVEDSRARRILTTHGRDAALIRFLREQGRDAAALATPWGEEEAGSSEPVDADGEEPRP
jgi:putative mRNA 3-end processing factor